MTCCRMTSTRSCRLEGFSTASRRSSSMRCRSSTCCRLLIRAGQPGPDRDPFSPLIFSSIPYLETARIWASSFSNSGKKSALVASTMPKAASFSSHSPLVRSKLLMAAGIQLFTICSHIRWSSDTISACSDTFLSRLSSGIHCPNHSCSACRDCCISWRSVALGVLFSASSSVSRFFSPTTQASGGSHSTAGSMMRSLILRRLLSLETLTSSHLERTHTVREAPLSSWTMPMAWEDSRRAVVAGTTQSRMHVGLLA
mmetsp:Transcript_3181/g.7988  ORF Transcript_3181/g.7988 Transcript_3181/m.7988 type:complete len:256 (-) Transcript_3181:966-1733(-)